MSTSKVLAYATKDVEERNVTLALHDMFGSIAESGATEEPLELICKCLVRSVDAVKFAFYCYKGDETGKIAAVKEGLDLLMPSPDVARKVVANLWKCTCGCDVAILDPKASLSLLSSADRKKWKCHRGCAVRVIVGKKPVAILAVFVAPDSVITDRQRAWMALFGDAASALVTRQHMVVQAMGERDAAMRAKASATLELESMRTRILQHLREFGKAKSEYLAGTISVRDAQSLVEKSAKALNEFSDVSVRASHGHVRSFKDKELGKWIRQGHNDPRIKAIVGLRGSNKSGILHAVYGWVLSRGVTEDRVVIIDFEDARFRRFKTAKDVIGYLDTFPATNKTRYLFLDEVGMIAWHADLLRNLRKHGNWNVWVAASSARIVSEADEKDILVLRTWPNAQQPRTRDDLERIWCQIFMRDVVGGVDHPDIRAKEALAEYYSDHLGEVKSLREISTEMALTGRTMARTSVCTYRKALVDAYLIEISEIYDVFEERVVTSVGGRAFYTDLELRSWRYGSAPDNDSTRVALNRLYLELRQKYDKVYTPRERNADFVTLEPNGKPCFWKLPNGPLTAPDHFRGGGVSDYKCHEKSFYLQLE